LGYHYENRKTPDALRVPAVCSDRTDHKGM
jgi:hypothetical protein